MKGQSKCYASLASAVALLATCLLLAASPAASADVFGPIALVSRIAAPFVPEQDQEQFEYAHDPSISANGRYVAFDGSFRGVKGVWRRDLQTGEVLQVAGGAAELPSISSEGRYVSFTTDEGGQLAADTNEKPLPVEHPEAPNVYRRDMGLAPTEADAFAIVSAVNGSEEPLTYQTPHPALYGSQAAGRSAMSADGQKVVFVTTAVSNLAGPDTPSLQVAVRDLETDQTELVSAEASHEAGSAPKPVQGEAVGEDFIGAVYTQGTPRFQPEPVLYRPFEHLVGASISADGSTVAWMGQNIAAQAQVLPGEKKLSALYAEPLWRRISDLPASPTRRVTGGADPENPACAASGQETLAQYVSPEQAAANPCQGPFQVKSELVGLWSGSSSNDTPQLSENGDEVAFLSNAIPVSLGSDYGLNGESVPNDLYLANMQEGLTRTQALTSLTAVSTGNFDNVALSGSILECSISPNGQQVAFTTQRTEFPLGTFTDVTPPAAEAGLAELYDVDLGDDTLTRVTEGYEGGPSEHPHERTVAGGDPYRSFDGAFSPSFAGDDDTIAFSSTASNLVYGDGNTPAIGLDEEVSDGSDAFTVSKVLFDSHPTIAAISPPPADPLGAPPWTLGVTAASEHNGNVLLYVDTPGAGKLQASARGTVLVAATAAAHGARNGAHGARQGAHGASRAAHGAYLAGIGARGRQALATRTETVASKSANAGGGLVTLVLQLAPRYRRLADRLGGLTASAVLSFAVPGRPTLHQDVTVTFLQVAASASRAKPRAKRARRGR